MNKDRKVAIGQLLALGISVLTLMGANAATLENFSSYALTRMQNDDNVFRSSMNEESDTVSHLGAGMEADFRLNQHHLLLEASLDNAWYNTFDQLDHTQVDGRGTFQMEFNRRWFSNISYGYNQRLSSFDEQSIRQKDMRTTHDFLANGIYKINTDWQVGGQLDYTELSYDKRDYLELNIAGGQVEALYRNTLDSRIGIRLRHADYDLRDSVFNSMSINNDFTETTLSGLVYWEHSGKSSLEASLGFTDVAYNELDSRDYQGGSGRLTYYWVPTGKTRLDASLWQEVSTLDRDISSYVLSRGFSVKPVWSVTSKISLEALVMFSNDDFKGDNELQQIINAQTREDDVWSYKVGVIWKPRDQIRVNLDYRKKDRDSTIDTSDFVDNQINAGVRLSF